MILCNDLIKSTILPGKFNVVVQYSSKGGVKLIAKCHGLIIIPTRNCNYFTINKLLGGTEKFVDLIQTAVVNIPINYLLKAKIIQINSSVPFLQNPCPWFVIVDHKIIVILLIWF